VLAAIDVPLVVWGSANKEKDVEILKAVAEAVDDRQLLIGPIQEDNYKQIGAAVLAYKHIAIPSSPIDINLAKQLNILLGNLGVSEDKMIMDPTVGGLGYGMEYSYSVMERARMAALLQQDDKLQFPMYCNLGREVWKTKEAKLSAKEAPELGDPSKRGVLMETITASAVLITGANVLVLRHPETVKLVRALLTDFDEVVDIKAAKPVAKVAAKPAAKPAPKPAAKPAPKPVAKPAPAAAPKPAPVAAPKPVPAAAPKPAPVAVPKPAPVAAPVAAPKPAPVAVAPAVSVSSNETANVVRTIEAGDGGGAVQIVIYTGDDEATGSAGGSEMVMLKQLLEQQQEEIALLKELIGRR
ncbi:MAG: hypothetical protein ACTSW2_08520, partial [Alphaproteobacteria bacterium]